MKKALSSLGMLCLGVGLLAASAGCEAQKCDVPVGDGEVQQGVCLKSLKKFRGSNSIVRQAEWLPGQPVTIDGINGDINVVQGSGTTVVATFDPWVFRAYDTPREEAVKDLESLEGTADGDSSGAVTVRSRRIGTVPSTLGADITVQMPPTFDGALTVHQNNGSTNIDFSGSATAVNLKSDNGSSNVLVSGTATTLDLFGDNGDLSVSVPGVPPGAGARSIHTDLGDIRLSFQGVPAATKFSVQAFAPDGIVNVNGAEAAGCALVDPVNPGSKTVSCNGASTADPVYKVNADSLSDIAVTF